MNEEIYRNAIERIECDSQFRPIGCCCGGRNVPGPTGPTGPTGPSGEDGIDGATGPAPGFAIGTVTTGAPGTNASVTITPVNN